VFDSEGALARALARGEPEADREVRDLVRRFLAAGRLGLPADVRRDLEQEVMIELWQAVRRPAFDLERELGGFVRVLCARRAIDWWRARRSESELVEGIADPRRGPLDDLLAAERGALARRTFATLAESCRELMRKLVVDRLSYREIAARSGRNEGALRVQLHRCVEQARRKLFARGLPGGAT
jgi:RNA polymerase sigma-70 factor (ECF subfamily)